MLPGYDRVAIYRVTRRVATDSAGMPLLAVELLQGVVGFTQYVLDLPEGLVSLHMLGAALTSAGLAWVVVATRRTPA